MFSSMRPLGIIDAIAFLQQRHCTRQSSCTRTAVLQTSKHGELFLLVHELHMQPITKRSVALTCAAESTRSQTRWSSCLMPLSLRSGTSGLKMQTRSASDAFLLFVSSSVPRTRDIAGPSKTCAIRGGHARGRESRKRRGRQAPRMQNGNNAASDPFAGPKVIKRQPASSLNGQGTSVLLFRNDLRLRDNAALALANTAQIILPLYVFDETQFGLDHASPYGFQRTGPFRAHFLRQAVSDVRDCLITRGSDMLIRTGNPVEHIEEIVVKLLENDLGPVHFVAHKEVTKEEIDVENAIEAKLAEIGERFGTQIGVHWVWGATMHHIDDLPFNPGGVAVPPTFSAYRKRIEAEDGPDVRDEIPVREPLLRFPLGLMLKNEPLPSLGEDLFVEGVGEPNDYPFPDHRAVMTFVGGPTAGDARVKDYVWDKYGLEVYKEMRNGSGTMDFSSKFSPWLALGCLSPRVLYWECKRFEMEVAATESTYWMELELMTRDYFRWVAASVGSKLFAHNGYSSGSERAVWKLPDGKITALHRERLQRWIDGATGAPFVDASMRELKYTGYMSNRGRQNVASFLINDLEFPDWRAGAEYFESMLIDHDVASNWCNWAYIAGVGSDPRGGRRFNVVKQSLSYDPDGWFIRGWCHELLRVPGSQIHEPHLMSEKDCEEYQVTKGESYPLPIVPLAQASTPNAKEKETAAT